MSDSEDTAHVFDQTNGVVDGFEGESDGTAESDVTSAAERDGGDGLLADGARDDDPGTRVQAAREDGAASAGATAGATTRPAEATTAEPGTSAADGAEHTYAVDRAGTAIDTDADDAPRPAGGAHVATADDVARTDTLRHDTVRDDTAQSDAVRTGNADTTPADGIDRADDAASGTASGLGALADDDSIGHVFDQTNGVIDGVEGESDGSAYGDDRSAGERASAEPVIDDAAVRDDTGDRDDEASRRNPSL